MRGLFFSIFALVLLPLAALAEGPIYSKPREADANGLKVEHHWECKSLRRGGGNPVVRFNPSEATGTILVGEERFVAMVAPGLKSVTFVSVVDGGAVTFTIKLLSKRFFLSRTGRNPSTDFGKCKSLVNA
jgi:hypothetical protein